jgi:sugar lactone lactonase YvrE
MSDLREDAKPGVDAQGQAKEEAQRRIEEILGQRERATTGRGSRRKRAILIAVLIILLLLLAGVAAFLYRIIAPRPSSTGGAEGDAGLNGVTWVRSIYGYGPTESQQFTNPNDTAVGPDGTIWVTDPGHFQVVGFRGDGTFVGRVQGNKQTGNPFRVPSRVAVDSAGIMYVADRPNQILTIMDGQTQLASAGIPGLASVDVNDEMVVVGSLSGFAILDKDGNVKTLVGTRGSGDDQFDYVGGVAIDSAKRVIYCVDTYNNRLSAWDYSGKRKWITQLGNPANAVKLQGGGNLVTTSTADAALQLPTDVAIDGKGRPIVLDAFDFSISAFNPSDGKFVDKWGAYGSRDGQFLYPTGFSYDASKDWFVVADTQNLRAEIIRIKGTGAGGASGALSGLRRLLAGPARALWPCLALIPLLLLLLLFGRRKKRRDERRSLQDPVELDGEAVLGVASVDEF